MEFLIWAGSRELLTSIVVLSLEQGFTSELFISRCLALNPHYLVNKMLMNSWSNLSMSSTIQ